jgi:hypothetical protein
LSSLEGPNDVASGRPPSRVDRERLHHDGIDVAIEAGHQ